LLTRRIASAAVLIPLVAVAVYLGGWYLTGLLTLAGLLATGEYCALARRHGLAPLSIASLLMVPVVMVDAHLVVPALFRGSVTLFVAGTLVAFVWQRNRPGSLESWGVTVSSLFIGLGLAHFISLRALSNGIVWVALALVGTWISDTGAYWLGSRFGRHKLAPDISPHKSWEGVWGGLITGLITVWAIARFALYLPHWQGAVLGLVLVAAATLGDLAESVIKRQAGVKDSGNLIPGHGGMLDRVDSLLFVAPAVYYVALLLA
jgi:phosphatidate cytidylyltransferase